MVATGSGEFFRKAPGQCLFGQHARKSLPHRFKLRGQQLYCGGAGAVVRFREHKIERRSAGGGQQDAFRIVFDGCEQPAGGVRFAVIAGETDQQVILFLMPEQRFKDIASERFSAGVIFQSHCPASLKKFF
ncbi:MAG TPA: hypothetical protein K8W19_03865 [Victivallis vadensis]|nr:hypothetical protein [Victivallis vadensis]